MNFEKSVDNPEVYPIPREVAVVISIPEAGGIPGSTICEPKHCSR